MYWLAGALFVSVAVLGFAPALLPGHSEGSVALIAPMGASVMLMLLVPASAFAKPTTVIVANAVATAIGLFVPHLLPSLVIASAAAMAGTVAVMAALRTIHPPSAGLALFAVSQGAMPLPQSVAFLLGGVMLRTALLVVLAIGLNRLGGLIFAAVRTGDGQ